MIPLAGILASLAAVYFGHRVLADLKRKEERAQAEVHAVQQRAQFSVIPGGPRRTESWAVITYRETS